MMNYALCQMGLLIMMCGQCSYCINLETILSIRPNSIECLASQFNEMFSLPIQWHHWFFDTSVRRMKTGKPTAMFLYSRGLTSGTWNGYLTKSPEITSFVKKVSLILVVDFEKLSKETMEGPFAWLPFGKSRPLSRHQLFQQMAAIAISQCLPFFLMNFTMPFLS